MVKVKFFATFREVTQEKEIEVEVHSVEGLLYRLVDRYGKKLVL
jgi:molybdopterin converting factor small subunit